MAKISLKDFLWKAYHGYASRIDGQIYALANEGATVLAPVELDTPTASLQQAALTLAALPERADSGTGEAARRAHQAALDALQAFQDEMGDTKPGRLLRQRIAEVRADTFVRPYRLGVAAEEVECARCGEPVLLNQAESTPSGSMHPNCANE